MRTTPKVFTVPRGQQSQHIYNSFLGERPKCIAICMMDNDSYSGNYKRNSFNFQRYNLIQIEMCKQTNMHELINEFTNDYVTLLPCENGANVNNKG